MAISSGQVTVGLEPTLIDGTHNSNFRLVIQNMNNDDSIYLGDETVSPETGLQLLKLETIQLELNPLEHLYAISTKTGLKISYLKQV
jgi:hypothetical protein